MVFFVVAYNCHRIELVKAPKGHSATDFKSALAPVNNMANENSDMSDNTLLRCGLCRNRFKVPKLLPCSHSFCLECLVAYKHGLPDQSFSCPACKREVALPPNGIKGLPLNVCFVNLSERMDFFEQLTAQAGKAQKCNFCQRDDIVAFCLECSIAICATCQKGHSRLPGMKVHTVLRIERVTDAKYMAKVVIAKAPYCTKHEREKFRYYCKGCSRLVCRDCTILDHRDHECIEAKSQAPKTKEELVALIDQGEKQKQEYMNFIEKGTRGIHSIDLKAQEECQKVEKMFDDLVETLKANKDALCIQIQTIKDDKVASIQRDINSANVWVNTMNNAQRLTRKIVELNNPWEILALCRCLNDAFQSLRSQAEVRKQWGYNELDLSASFSPGYTPEQASNIKLGDMVEESLVLLNYDPVKNEVIRHYVPK